MKTLTIKQVKSLAEKGIEFNDTLLVHWFGNGEDELVIKSEIDPIIFPNFNNEDYLPAPILQEVLDKLPRTITHKENNYSLTFMPSMIEGRFGLGYYRLPHEFAIQITESTMSCAYKMLNWVIDNGHLTDKNNLAF